MILISITCLLLIAVINSHSTKYNIDRNTTCYNPTPAKVESYHVHMLFWTHVDTHVQKAFDIRSKFLDYLNLDASKDACPNGLFHNDDLCVLDVSDGTESPFLTSDWSVYFLPKDYYRVISWIMQNRDGMDIVIHPNSGCELEDHTWWTLWGGNVWQINTEIFDHEAPWFGKEQTKLELLEDKDTPKIIKQFMQEHEN